MGLHRLTSITLGVPNVRETADYYTSFGLTPLGDGRFATQDGGEQLKIVHSPLRRLVELGVGVADPDDLDRVTSSLARLDVTGKRDDTSLRVHDPNSNIEVVLEIADRIVPTPAEQVPYNGPGRPSRPNGRARGDPAGSRARPAAAGQSHRRRPQSLPRHRKAALRPVAHRPDQGRLPLRAVHARHRTAGQDPGRLMGASPRETPIRLGVSAGSSSS